MRVVFDTNIYISAFLFPGSAPEFILKSAFRRDFELFASDFILQEFERVLREKFKLANEEVQWHLAFVSLYIKIVQPTQHAAIVKTKKDDNRILEAAEAADADFLVTGDKKHLLALKKYKKTKIISASQFAKMLDKIM